VKEQIPCGAWLETPQGSLSGRKTLQRKRVNTTYKLLWLYCKVKSVGKGFF
jgi:hypothetical protein